VADFPHTQYGKEVDMATEAALLAAFSRIWRMNLPVLAICLPIIGASLVGKPLLTKTT
jgi:hypothetical protein